MLLDKQYVLNVLNNKPDLLIGNGFSIALTKHAEMLKLSEMAVEDKYAGQVIAELGAGNIESMLHLLEKMERISELQPLLKYLNDLQIRIKTTFIRTLVGITPSTRNDVCDSKVIGTRTLLEKFDLKFTVNFDPFLYWALLDSIGPWMQDGFSHYERPNKFFWSAATETKTWWLHGSIFHFLSDGKTYKVSASREQKFLEAIKEEMVKSGMPNLILGGTSDQKLNHIFTSDYLVKALSKFSERSNPLVIFGWSNSSNDAHLERLIGNRKVYFAVHQPESREGQRLHLMAVQNNWNPFDSSLLPFWEHQGSGFCSCE